MAEPPDHLRDVVEDLRRAYPDGVPDEDYLPLLAVLATDFSEEGSAWRSHTSRAGTRSTSSTMRQQPNLFVSLLRVTPPGSGST